jgi:hypothetical protein
LADLWHLLSCAQRSAIFTMPMTFDLLNYRVRNCTCSCTHCLLFLAHISCGEPSSRRRVFGSLSFLSAPTFHCHTAGLCGSRSCRSLTLSDVPVTANVLTGRRSIYLQFVFFAISSNPRQLRQLGNPLLTQKPKKQRIWKR